MRIKRAALAAMLAFIVLTNCVDVAVHTKVDDKGAGVQKWRFVTSSLMSAEIKKQVQSSPFFAGKKPKYTEEFKEGDYILDAEIRFDDVTQLRDKDHDVSFEKSGFVKRRYKYTETWKQNPGGVSGPITMGPGSMLPINLQMTVELPGKIIATNAEKVLVNQAQWQITLNELGAAKTMYIQTEVLNVWGVLPFGILALILLTAAIVLMVRRKPRPSDLTSCKHCGKQVPAASSFCNHCGSKLDTPGE